MDDPAAAAERQAARPQGVVVGLVTLPFRVFGALCASLLLSVLLEWIGMHFWWPAQGWHHAQRMLHYELHEISASFAQSLLLSHPAATAHQLIATVYAKVFDETRLATWAKKLSAQRLTEMPHANILRHGFSLAYAHLKPYALAAGYTLLTFLARLLVLTLTLPLFILAALVGLIDGLVRRDLRRFGAGHESGFLYHRARAAILPIAILPWVLYLALPVSVPPLAILLPAAMLLALAVNITAASFKKYL
ncbi:MAG: TIGR03747 family integrating conjugative element membrane protein [Steroidobacteraceae bacterium]